MRGLSETMTDICLSDPQSLHSDFVSNYKFLGYSAEYVDTFCTRLGQFLPREPALAESAVKIATHILDNPPPEGEGYKEEAVRPAYDLLKTVVRLYPAQVECGVRERLERLALEPSDLLTGDAGVWNEAGAFLKSLVAEDPVSRERLIGRVTNDINLQAEKLCETAYTYGKPECVEAHVKALRAVERSICVLAGLAVTQNEKKKAVESIGRVHNLLGHEAFKDEKVPYYFQRTLQSSPEWAAKYDTPFYRKLYEITPSVRNAMLTTTKKTLLALGR